jgi:hypothetical protein
MGNNQPYVIFIADDDDDHTLYHLYRDLIDPSRFPTEEENQNWCAVVWDECGIRDLDYLCTEYIQKYATLKHVPRQDVTRFHSTIDWLNALYTFISRQDQDKILEKYKIVPNVNGEFITLHGMETFQGPTISRTALNCLNDLGDDWRPKLIDSRILSLNVRIRGLEDPRTWLIG